MTKLRLTISGLFIYVPDPATGKVHLVAPLTGHPVFHETHLLFDPRYVTGTSGPFQPFNRVALADQNLTVNLGTGAPAIPEEIVDLRDVSKVSTLALDPKHLKGGMSVACISLQGGSFVPRTLCNYVVNGRARRLAGMVDWVVEIPEDGLPELKTDPRSGATSQRQPPLKPIDGEVWIGLVHLPTAWIPQTLDTFKNPGDDGIDHFDMYYDLFPGVTTRAVPQFVNCDGNLSPEPHNYALLHPMRCAGTQVPLK